jgi:hypothetical protein
MHNPASATGSRDTALDTDETTHLATRNAVVRRSLRHRRHPSSSPSSPGAEDTYSISLDLRGTGGTPVRPGERDQESRSRGPREQDRTDAPPDGSHTRGRRSAAGRLAVGSWTRLSTCSAGQRARPMPMQQPADVASGAWRKERAGERKERVTRASSPSTDRNRGRISRRSDCSPHLESQTQLVIATQLPQESQKTHSRDADLAGG